MSGLRLYKRHNCGRTDELDFSCLCPIWITGRLPDGQLVPRQSTGAKDEHSAKAIRSDLIRRYTKTSEVQGLPIQRAVDEYLASRRDEMIEATAAQYRHVLSRLMTYCENVNVHFMSALTVDIIDSFSVAGFEGQESTTRAVGMSKVSAFLRDAFRRGWIKEPLAVQIKSVAAVYEEKKPYTVEEVNLVLAGCAGMSSSGRGYGSQPATFRLLLELMLETGMRAGDSIRFNPRLLVKSELWMYRFLPQKRRKVGAAKYLDVYLSNRLKHAIDRAVWLSPTLPFAWGNFTRHTYLANEVYYRMQAIGNRVGVADCRPHRLRDTFAVRMLERGLTLDDVSRLLGHSSVKVTEKYYARWSRGRGSLLESKVYQAFS